jgi:hypothetical protein
MEPSIPLPASFLYAVGAIVLMNVGTLITLIVLGVRCVWWFSKLDSRLEAIKSMSIRAHKRLDKLEGLAND